MNRGMIMIIVVLLIGYIIGAKFPGMAAKLGVA